LEANEISFEQGGIEGETPVVDFQCSDKISGIVKGESNCLRVRFKLGGIYHLRLNTNKKPIANKYREGKLKRTLKRELKEFEIVEMELIYFKINFFHHVYGLSPTRENT